MEGNDSSILSLFDSWLVMIIAIVLVLYLLRRWIKGGQFTESVSAKNMVAIVTGANSGIGLQICRELNKRGAKVYMLCRDRTRGEEAMQTLARYGCLPTRLILEIVDLADFKTIRAFVETLKKQETKIDILVNNAGIMLYPKFQLTVDGYEMTWQSNHLGHFLLTELLLPLLTAAPSARIVIVSSKLHANADTVDSAVVNNRNRFGRLQSYNRSKLANVMHARELTRRLRASDASHVTVNSCHPGVCATNLIRHTLLTITPIKQLYAPFNWFLFKTDQDGAQTPLFLALSRSVNGVSGKYYSDCKEAKCCDKALDDNACSTLYNDSIEQCGLDK